VGKNVDGVRSISFSGGGRLLTCGGGGGKLTFYDMRAGHFLPATRAADAADATAATASDGQDSGQDSGYRGGNRDGHRDGSSHSARADGDEDNGTDTDTQTVASLPQNWQPLRHRPGDSSSRGGIVDASPLSFQMGEGFLDRQHHIYTELFSDGHVLGACYAHAWDASGTKLLVAGGPLAYGLRGCYVGIWR